VFGVFLCPPCDTGTRDNFHHKMTCDEGDGGSKEHPQQSSSGLSIIGASLGSGTRGGGGGGGGDDAHPSLASGSDGGPGAADQLVHGHNPWWKQQHPQQQVGGGHVGAVGAAAGPASGWQPELLERDARNRYIFRNSSDPRLNGGWCTP